MLSASPKLDLGSFVIVFLALAAVPVPVAGQEPANTPAASEMQIPNPGKSSAEHLRGVAGEITSRNSRSLVLKTIEGKAVRINLDQKTHFRKDRQPAKVSDFKVGDLVFIGGQPAGEGVWNAEIVASRTGGTEQSIRDSLGKVFIVGDIKAIRGTNLVILRPDGVTQTIAVDENTSFRKGEESITLADFKAGDHVFGRGEVKNEVFVPSLLGLGEPRFLLPRDENEPR